MPQASVSTLLYFFAWLYPFASGFRIHSSFFEPEPKEEVGFLKVEERSSLQQYPTQIIQGVLGAKQRLQNLSWYQSRGGSNIYRGSQ